MRPFRLAAACLALLAPTHAGDLPKIVLPDQSTATWHRDGLHSVHMLLHRRPVLVLSWRADDPATLDDIIPAMLALEAEQAGDLALLFVERSGLSYTDMLKLVARRHWLCGPGAWTCEVPSGAEALEAPSFVLTSPSHATVLAGHPLTDAPALRKAVLRAVDERRFGASYLPPDVREAIKALHEDRLADALGLPAASKALRKRGQPGDPEAADDIDAQVHVIEDDLNVRFGWANEMLAVGTGLAAKPRVEALVKAFASLPPENRWRRQAEDDLSTFTHGEQAAELKASAELFKYQEQLCAKGPTVPISKALQKVAKTHAGTHAGERMLLLGKIATP